MGGPKEDLQNELIVMRWRMHQAGTRNILLCYALLVVAFGSFPSAYSQVTDKAGKAIASTLLSESGPTFRVPDGQIPKNWTIIAYGDTRFTDPSNHEVTNPEARRALVAKIAAEHPDAVLITGDIPYNGGNANDYAVYHTETAAWRDEGLRIYPAIGNHELRGDEIKQPANWWNTFPELKGRRWYSVEFGNTYIICLDSDLPLTDGSRQQKWLADQLDHLPEKTQFAFLTLHHPPVADSILNNSSHDVRPNEKALAILLQQKAHTLHAHIIVVAGHIHNYQRFYQDGVIYLVSGGGGAKPYPVARTPADLFQDPSFPNFHYIKFQFDGAKLVATMFRLADSSGADSVWESKDHFTIESPEAK
jgi:3',5'-cyclic AMP phosphodiesterase CpdA